MSVTKFTELLACNFNNDQHGGRWNISTTCFFFLSVFWNNSFLEHLRLRFCYHIDEILNAFPNLEKVEWFWTIFQHLILFFLKEKIILVSTSKNMQPNFFWPVARIVALVLSNLWLFPLPLTMKTLLFITAFSKITGASISSDVDRIMKMVFSLSFLHVWQRVLLSKLILHQPFWD